MLTKLKIAYSKLTGKWVGKYMNYSKQVIDNMDMYSDLEHRPLYFVGRDKEDGKLQFLQPPPSDKQTMYQ
jgi:hypothetical protein